MVICLLHITLYVCFWSNVSEFESKFQLNSNYQQAVNIYKKLEQSFCVAEYKSQVRNEFRLIDNRQQTVGII